MDLALFPGILGAATQCQPRHRGRLPRYFRLLLQYWRQQRRRALATLSPESLTPDTVLSFLNHLEESRGNTIRTRNARLAALRSFVHYLTDWLGPELPAAARRILTLPFKRQVKPLIGFLTRPEIEALLAATADTWTGRRDHSYGLRRKRMRVTELSTVLALSTHRNHEGSHDVSELAATRDEAPPAAEDSVITAAWPFLTEGKRFPSPGLP